MLIYVTNDYKKKLGHARKQLRKVTFSSGTLDFLLCPFSSILICFTLQVQVVLTSTVTVNFRRTEFANNFYVLLK